MWSEVKVGEDVALRLAHSAERQPRGNDIDEHHRERPANRTGLPQKLGKVIYMGQDVDIRSHSRLSMVRSCR
jgi:hypothetical protein